MIRRVATLLALLALLGAAGAGAAPQKHYLRLTAQANFNLQLDYGSDPRAVYNGKYQKSINYQSRAIVVFNGSSVSLLPGASMVVQGRVAVLDERTQWASAGSRKPVTCSGPGAVPDTPGYFQSLTGPGDRPGFEITSGGGVTVGAASGLYVDTGTALTRVGCAATEGLENHGLRGGPSFAVSAPQKSRFSGLKAFSVSCSDNYSHSLEESPEAPDGNRHSFNGSVQVSVTLTPFPASKLKDVKRVLRDSVGKNLPYPTGGKPKDCLQ